MVDWLVGWLVVYVCVYVYMCKNWLGLFVRTRTYALWCVRGCRDYINEISPAAPCIIYISLSFLLSHFSCDICVDNLVQCMCCHCFVLTCGLDNKSSPNDHLKISQI